MDIVTNFFSTAGGAIVGGAIGYFFSHLQWKKAIEREERLKRIEELKSLIALAYDSIEYIRDYWANSQYMEIQDFMACMAGRDPTSKILSVVVGSVPEMRAEAENLKDAIGDLKGPDFPVPKDKFESVVQVANEFGAKANQYVRAHS